MTGNWTEKESIEELQKGLERLKGSENEQLKPHPESAQAKAERGKQRRVDTHSGRDPKRPQPRREPESSWRRALRRAREKLEDLLDRMSNRASRLKSRISNLLSRVGSMLSRLGTSIGRILTGGRVVLSGLRALLLGGLAAVAVTTVASLVLSSLFGGSSQEPEPGLGEVGAGTSGEVGAVTQSPSSFVIDTSGTWRLSWTWVVTTVSFTGELAGSDGQWTFTGGYEGGGNAIWTPEDASATCQLSGDLDSGDATMTCNVAFSDGGAWIGDSEGRISLYGDEVKRFGYAGEGSGSSPSDEAALIRSLTLDVVTS